jgi:hypothetical protein
MTCPSILESSLGAGGGAGDYSSLRSFITNLLGAFLKYINHMVLFLLDLAQTASCQASMSGSNFLCIIDTEMGVFLVEPEDRPFHQSLGHSLLLLLSLLEPDSSYEPVCLILSDAVENMSPSSLV